MKRKKIKSPISSIINRKADPKMGRNQIINLLAKDGVGTSVHRLVLNGYGNVP